MRKVERAVLADVSAKLDQFLAASRGEPSRCASFESRPGFGVEPFTEAQRTAIRVYVESWIDEPLKAALDAIDGERGWTNESYLQSVVGERGAA